jgi:hypothetical protein
MDFDENYIFYGNVRSCTFYKKNCHYKIFLISSPDLTPKLKFAENRKKSGKIGNSRITLKFQEMFWDIYYFSERLRHRLYNEPQEF